MLKGPKKYRGLGLKHSILEAGLIKSKSFSGLIIPYTPKRLREGEAIYDELEASAREEMVSTKTRCCFHFKGGFS